MSNSIGFDMKLFPNTENIRKCSNPKCETLVQLPLIKCSPCRGISYDTPHKVAMKKREKRLRGAV